MSVDGTGLMYLHYDSSTLHDRHTEPTVRYLLPVQLLLRIS